MSHSSPSALGYSVKRLAVCLPLLLGCLPMLASAEPGLAALKVEAGEDGSETLSLIHISEPTRLWSGSRMPSSA